MSATAIAAKLPVFFLSHGSPTAGFSIDDTSKFWKALGEKIHSFPGLKALLMVSAHWETSQAVHVNTTAKPQTIHDFYGFPAHMYEYHYPGKGEPSVAKKIIDLLSDAGMPVKADASHGLDHGAWVPLKWMLPGGDIPVVQVSLLRGGAMEEHHKMGEALAPLRAEGVLIICSGGAVHNLQAVRRHFAKKVPNYRGGFDAFLDGSIAYGDTSDYPKHITEFDARLKTALTAEGGRKRHELLLGLGREEILSLAHPSPEHLMPAYVASGAAGPDRGTQIFSGYWMTLSNASYSFGFPAVATSAADVSQEQQLLV